MGTPHRYNDRMEKGVIEVHIPNEAIFRASEQAGVSVCLGLRTCVAQVLWDGQHLIQRVAPSGHDCWPW